MPVTGNPMSDRYQLANEFQTEQIRRTILKCEQADDLRVICLKLLKMCHQQKEFITDLLLP